MSGREQRLGRRPGHAQLPKHEVPTQEGARASVRRKTLCQRCKEAMCVNCKNVYASLQRGSSQSEQQFPASSVSAGAADALLSMHVPAYAPMDDAEGPMPDWQAHMLKVVQEPHMLYHKVRDELHAAHMAAVKHLLTRDTLVLAQLEEIRNVVHSHAQAVLALRKMILGWSSRPPNFRACALCGKHRLVHASASQQAESVCGSAGAGMLFLDRTCQQVGHCHQAPSAHMC